MNEEKSNKIIILSILGCIVLIFLCIFLLIKLNDDGTSNYSKDKLYIQCYSFSQDLVKNKLKSPKTAKFPSYSDSFITDNGDTIIVTAYVNAQNSFGATIKTNYVATIKIDNNKPKSGSVYISE